jgi:hypothetical protein
VDILITSRTGQSSELTAVSAVLERRPATLTPK